LEEHATGRIAHCFGIPCNEEPAFRASLPRLDPPAHDGDAGEVVGVGVDMPRDREARGWLGPHARLAT
jgi:hypothetical protein